MLSGSASQYTVTGLEEYGNYTCEVISIGVFGTFSYPSTANFTTLEAAPTGPPLLPYGVAVNPMLIDVLWSPPRLIDINGIIDFYIVERTELATGIFEDFHAVDEHIFIGPVRPGFAYLCRVAAFTVGQGPFTDYFVVTSQELAPSAPPDNVTALFLTSSSFLLDWDPPPFEHHNGVIRNYTISVELLENSTAYNITTNVTQYAFNTLLPFYTYRVMVAASTEPGMGPWSAALDVVLPESAPSAPPQNIDGFALDDMSIQLTWDPPPLYQQNGFITSYFLNITERDTGLIFTRSTTDLQITLANLHPYYIYECHVAAVTVARGPYTPTFPVRVLVSSPSTPPVDFVATPTSPRSILLRWDPPLPENRNGPITYYLVDVVVMETQMMFEINTTMTTHHLFQLTPFTTYNFTIAASTEVGLGPFTSPSSVQTPEDVPSEPRSFAVSTIAGSPRSLSISWLPPEILNGIIVQYTIYCTEELESDMEASGMGTGFGEMMVDPDSLMPENITTLVVTVAGNETEVTFPNLIPYTVYSCFASASTSAGEGNFTGEISARTDESVPDDAPGDLLVVFVTARTCFLTWTTPLVPNGILISHTVTYNFTSGDGGLASLTAAADATSYLVTGLHPYEYYQLSVFASTRIGRSPVSTVTIMTEEASPATPPRNVFSFVISPRSASISWLPPRPEDQNGIIRYYILRLVDERLGYDDVIINTTLTSHTFTNLEEYNLYSYSVAAATNAGLSNYSGPDQFTTHEDVPTAAPQNITNTVHSATRVSFVWLPPPPREINGLLRFYIIELVERHTMRDWIFFAIDPDISISSLHPYYLYDFKVTAYTIDRGPYSDIVTVLTDEATPIAPPQEITADEVASSYLTLTWTPPPFEETNGIIRYYMIRVSEVDTGTSLFVTANETEVTIPDLHPYYTYECNVAAFTVGLGPYSGSITTQLLEEAPTAEPQGVSGMSIGSDAIYLSWDPPPFPHQNGLIRQYLINVTELDTGTSFQQTSTSTTFTIYSLHPYYTYEFTLVAVTVGAGPASSPIAVQTDEDIPSGPVVNPAVNVTSSTSLLLSWEPPELEDQNGVILGYVINITAVETGMNFELRSTETTLAVDSLRPFTTYICRIAARTVVGIGPFSIAVTAVTSQDAPSGSPQNVSVISLSSTSLSISWEPPSLETQNGVITQYRVNVTEIETGSVFSYVSFTTQLSVQFLHPYYTYACIVSAVTNEEGPPSEMVVITTPEDVPSGYPQNFAGTAPSSQSVVLSWDPPPPEEQNGVIISYVINVTEAGSGAIFQLVASTNTSRVVSNLQPFTTYDFLIAAATSVGLGPFSRLLTIQTPEDVPENAPLNPVATATNSRTILFSWSVPLGRHNGIIREYRVNVTELQTGTTFQRSVSTTSIAVTSLQPSYTYRLSVTAYTVGEGPYSLPLNVTLPEDVPNGPPQNIIAVAMSSDTISLTWDPPLVQNQNGLITDYVVNYTALDTGEITQVVTSSRSLTVNALAPFSSYAFIVAARTALGAGPFSTDVTVQTLEDAPSSHPSNSTGYAINSTHIYLMWDPPPPEDVNGVIREYRINVTEVETGILRQFTTPANIRELVVGDLHPYYSYHSIIVAFTIEVGPNSTAITVRTEEAAPSGPPTNFVATVMGSRSIFLSWDAPPPDQWNGILRYYFVSLESDAGTETRNISSSLRSVTVDGLRPFTQYLCTVQAGTVDVGPPTTALLRSTLEDAPEGAPQSTVAQALSPTIFLLTWMPPLAGDGNGVVRNYTINITELETGRMEQYTTSDLNLTVSSRHPFYRYRYVLAAETIGLGPFTDPTVIHMPEAAPASAPVDIAASTITSTGFLLSWSSPPLQDHNGVIRNYSISIRELNTGNTVNLVSQTTSQLFDSLQPYYNYSVQVAAVTVAPGPFSPAFVIRTLEDIPSSSPQNLLISVESSRSLRLSWDSLPEESRNGIIIGYSVFITPDGGVTMEMTTNMTSFLAANLQPFTTYTFTVAARTSVGRGPLTPANLETTPEDAPEAAPTALLIHNITSTTISLSWEAPATELQNGVIRHYQIVAFEVDTNSSLTYRATANTFFTLGELHPYYTYRIAVQAVTVAAGPLSETVESLTLEDVPSDVPLSIQAAAINSTQLSLSWTPPSRETQNGVIIRYHVNISVSETGQRFQRVVDGAQTLVLNGLHPYYQYSYIIAAVTSIGRGPFSVRRTIRMPQDAPSSPPLRVVGETVDAERILLSWDLPEPAGRNGIITGHTVRTMEVPTGQVFSYNLTNHTDFLINNLHPYYDYRCSVASVTVVGAGPFSEPVTVRTNESVPSGSPVNLAVRAINSSTIELIWAEPPPDTHNGIIISYSIDVSVSETKTSFVVNATTAAALNITQLHPYYTYSFQVAALTSQGAGPLSSAISITTPEDVPTGSPLNTVAAALTSTSISFTWEPPSFELQNGIIRSYHINVTELETGQTWSYVIPGSETLLILNSLHPFYRYNFSIAANTTALGPAATVVIQTRQEAPSSVPGSVRVDIVSAVSVQVSWQPPPLDQQNGVISGYLVRVLGLNTEDNYVLPLVNDTSLIVDNLHPFYAYRFSVAAQTVAAGPFSAAVTKQLPEGAPIGVVGDVQVDITSPSTILVSWLPTDKDNWNGAILRYTVVYERLRSIDDNNMMTTTEGSGFGSIFVESISIPDDGQGLTNNPDPTRVVVPLRREQVTIDGLEEYHVYQLRVYYETSQGRSEQSSLTTLQTLSSAPSDSPIDVQAVSLSESTIRITWAPPPPLERNGVITSYLVNVTGVEDGVTKSYSVLGLSRSLTVEDLEIYAEYMVTMAARTQDGLGPYSDIIRVRTEESIPGPPTAVTVQPLNDASTSVAVSWQRPTDANGVITEYQVIYFGYTGELSNIEEIRDSIKTVNTRGNITRVTISDLTARINYAFTVRARTSQGYGANSTTYTIEVPGPVEEPVGNNSTVVAVVLAILGWILVVVVVVIAVILYVYFKKRRQKYTPGGNLQEDHLMKPRLVMANPVYDAVEGEQAIELDRADLGQDDKASEAQQETAVDVHDDEVKEPLSDESSETGSITKQDLSEI